MSEPDPREPPGDEAPPALSAAMRLALDQLERLAPLESPVLVTGERGAGKGRFARWLHERSARAAGPLVVAACGGQPTAQLEQVLFGTERRAGFINRTFTSPGRLDEAAGGTLVLDEVSELPLEMQAKLERALGERAVRLVGAHRDRPIDVRVVATTHLDLATEVAAGRFRQSLFNLLRQSELRVPPLRERREDIVPLARQLTLRAAGRHGLPVAGFTAAAADQLLVHLWPGNVRELQAAVEHAVVVAVGARFDAGDLPADVREARALAPVPAPSGTLAEVERAHILATLAAHNGHRARTAQALGIGEATLYRKLRDYRVVG